MGILYSAALAQSVDMAEIRADGIQNLAGPPCLSSADEGFIYLDSSVPQTLKVCVQTAASTWAWQDLN